MAEANRSAVRAIPQVSRRDLFVSATAAAAAFALPAAASTETPVARAFAEWRAFRDHIESARMPEEAFDAACGQKFQMELAMIDLPSVNLRDTALKLLAWTDLGTDMSDDGLRTGVRILQEMACMAAV